MLWPMGWWAHARGASVPVATVTQTDACRFRRITASTRPREEKRKVFWGKHLPGWQYAEVHLVEGNPRKGVPASAISGVSARGPPRPLACISTRVRFRSQV